MPDAETKTCRSLEDALEGHRFAMVTTVHGDAVTSRPLTLLEQDGSTLRFLVSRSAPWADEAEGGRPVNAAFADPGANSYTSVVGHARLSTDDALIDRLWNPVAGVYFEGRDDPDIAVLEIEVTGGEWWDGPSSKVGQALDLVRLKVTGSTADQHGDVEPA